MDLSLLVEYIEGKWADEDFLSVLKYNSNLCERVKKIYAGAINSCDYNVITRIFELNLDSDDDIKELIAIVERVLKYKNISYVKKQRIFKKLKIADIILPYLENDISAEKYISENILKNLSDIPQKQQKEYCIAKQKELFKYENYPPKWLQNGEWQYDADGNPLVFRKSYKENATCEIFVFGNPKNGETIQVKQYN